MASKKRGSLVVDVGRNSSPSDARDARRPKGLTTPDCMSSPVSHLRDLTRDLHEDGAKRRRAAQYLRESRETHLQERRLYLVLDLDETLVHSLRASVRTIGSADSTAVAAAAAATTPLPLGPSSAAAPVPPAPNVDGIIEAIGVICEVTGSKQVNVSGACSGGITMSAMLSKLASKGDKRVNAISLMVCVLKPEITDSEVGSLVSEHGIELARQRSRKAGVLDGASLSRMFAWLRPNDLVWNYVVNNYLLGEDPPAFDILFWNNDATNLPAQLHSDYLDLYGNQPFAEPGTAEIAGHVVDLTKVTSDLYIVAGVTDHITPWKASYRSTQLFGSKNIEFILSHSGHIQAMLNPPGNPKAKFYRADGKAPPTPEKWMAKAEETAGSWWPHWAQWLKARAGAEKAAPTELGSKAHPPVGAAPGQYVFD
jgi:hypothetical protein